MLFNYIIYDLEHLSISCFFEQKLIQKIAPLDLRTNLRNYVLATVNITSQIERKLKASPILKQTEH